MCPSQDGITYRHAADGADNLYIWTAANVLKEQLRTVPNLGLDEGLSIKNRDTECYTGSRTWKRSFETIYAWENEHGVWSWECNMSLQTSLKTVSRGLAEYRRLIWRDSISRS